MGFRKANSTMFTVTTTAQMKQKIQSRKTWGEQKPPSDSCQDEKMASTDDSTETH